MEYGAQNEAGFMVHHFEKQTTLMVAVLFAVDWKVYATFRTSYILNAFELNTLGIPFL
jgi:hypothetical protein